MKKDSINWKPVWVVLGLDLAALAGVWFALDVMRHFKILLTDVLQLLAILALLVWALFFSGLSRRVRAVILGTVVVIVVFLLAFVRVRGMTGDWVPIFAWSWAPDPAAAVDPEPLAPEQLSLDTGPSFPQFAGRARDSRVPDVALARDFSVSPPELLWRQKIGLGWSGFAVAGGLAVTQEQRGPNEMVTAYELTSGRQVWTHADETRFEDTNWLVGVGPRATPTIDNETVFTLGATGIVNSLDLGSGELHWSQNLVEDLGGRLPEFGWSGSPLIHDGLVIVSAGAAGKSLVAFNRETGEQVWGAGDDEASYSSPLFTTLAGKAQIVILNRYSLAGHDPADGHILWNQPWESNSFPTAAQPLPLLGNRLLVSAAYGIGTKIFEISTRGGGYSSSTIWETPRFKAKFTQMIEIGGLVYGLDDGIMACFDPLTGERRWKRGRYGHGQTLLAGDLLLVSSEKGEIVLIEPHPDELRELSRFQALDGKVWNPHALAGPYLLVRNDLEAACYRLQLRP